MNINKLNSTVLIVVLLVVFAVAPVFQTQVFTQVSKEKPAYRGPVTTVIQLQPLAKEIENLDDITVKQLSYYAAIADRMKEFNTVNFLKPYSPEIKKNISELLLQVAKIESNECYQKYLTGLSMGVMRDSFYSAAPEWYSLEGNKTEVLFVPNEPYFQRIFLLSIYLPVNWKRIDFKKLTEEQGAALKGSPDARLFDTYIYINDERETWKYEEYMRSFNRIKEELPPMASTGITYTSRSPQIKIARLAYSSVSGRYTLVYPTPGIHYLQPVSDPRFKIVIFKNVTDAYFNCILKPIQQKLLASEDADPDSYLSNIVLHRIVHHLGPVVHPHSIVIGKLFISEVLTRDTFTFIEELKADVFSMYATPILIAKGLIPHDKESSIYSAHLLKLLNQLRVISQGKQDKAAVVQLNFLLGKGAIFFNRDTRKISINVPVFSSSMKELAKIVVENYINPYSAYAEYVQMNSELFTIAGYMKDIPRGVEFRF